MGLMKPKGPPVQPKGRRQIYDCDSGDNLVMLEQINVTMMSRDYIGFCLLANIISNDKQGSQFSLFLTADHRCIKCHIDDMTLDTPTISFRKPVKLRAQMMSRPDRKSQVIL